ncbi:NADH:ubiquinone oxidoreductase subunit A [Vulcanibacillus modesticaldus]|uniref:NADH-quinone oxidoreductase subunit A n=1 Tax=Vulcanibacillus modesticaldus TaxID=337097 RepID=A0A1D2YW07_9BACI|nr:NADH-quinone oxidoreductase subunit A [Vulcanibacillus modesticaldus]OEF99827.1 NADH:ubiquinone oxidoreductase subunit A [Vulcanibacillus modesticaldus]
MDYIYSNSYLSITIFILLGIMLPVAAIEMVSPLISPKKPSKEKSVTYESGILPTGDARVQFNVRYYLFALLFVVFDVETVFLYPWAAAFERLSQYSVFVLIEMTIFIFMLIIGLAYAWKKKVLSW